MSKAFVRENADEERDDAYREPTIGEGKRYITLEGFRKIETSLQHLWQVERPKITKEVAEAAAQGDRSENAEYIYGKRKLRQIDGRIRYLSKLLDRLTVVTAQPVASGKIFFGAFVELEDEQNKKSLYRLVGPDETDVNAGHISIESPMGRALLGKCEHDEVTVRRPRGECTFTIHRVWYARKLDVGGTGFASHQIL